MKGVEHIMEEIYSALLDIIRRETSPEAIKALNMIRRRVALENDVVPSRIPAPLNITQIGGYINLLERRGFDDLSYRMLATTLGLPANDLEATLYDVEPVAYFATVVSDRPVCDRQASLPLTYFIRSDFSPGLAAAVNNIHEAGGSIPLMSIRRPLPPLGSTLPGEKQAMEIIGRTLEIAPGAAMVNPETDPVIVTGEEDGKNCLYTLVQHGVDVAVYNAYVFDMGSSELTASEVSGKFIPLLPVLAAAGWYPPDTEAAYPPDMLKLWNITGLVPGVTSYGDELSLLYTKQQIVASTVRDMYNWVWDGKAFVQA
jgi:hypothetical protein